MNGQSTPRRRRLSRRARESIAYRFRESGVFDVTGDDRIAFLQGQLTQDVKTLAAGEARAAAGLSPKGKILYVARVLGLPDRIRLLVPAASREAVRDHLKKYVVFQKASIEDRSEEFVRIGIYGRREPPSPGFPAFALPGEGEFSAEILAETETGEAVELVLRAAGAIEVSAAIAEILRVEAGRPRFGEDFDSANLPDEVGMDGAISTTKGCYVGQEIVARMRTYGRANRRLVGFRFPEGLLPGGSVLKRPEEEEPGKIEQGRVTSAVVSPAFGPIGLGYAFREVSVGERLVDAANPPRGALVASLPFA